MITGLFFDLDGRLLVHGDMEAAWKGDASP